MPGSVSVAPSTDMMPSISTRFTTRQAFANQPNRP